MEEARRVLAELIEKYNHNKDDHSFMGNEKQACISLIVPLITKILHWDTEDPSEFKTEESQSGKRIDYVVLNQGISQFIVEAKAPSKDIFDNDNFYQQALGYGYGKQKDFAILTNFHQVVILACQVKCRVPREAELARFNLLETSEEELKLLLSFEKEYWLNSGKNNLLYSKLVKHTKTIPVDEQLLNDMREWREQLLRNIKSNSRHNKFDFEDEEEFMRIEEEVQKFIDRLIFICFCEDKELHESHLQGLIRDKRERFNSKPGWLLEKIQHLFGEYRRIYDSDLFDKNECDTFVIEDEIVLEILSGLREPKGRAAYDFKSIEADILGKTYENFIGHVQTGKKRFKEKEDIGKRKKEGIYYTPKYIVDYIVNNTVREYIKGKSFEEIKKVKILDPACGSGSFLRVAFDVLVEECERSLKRKLTYEEKMELLLNCIYGVDLDPRAVEIAKFNLSLKLAERGKHLPVLRENIRLGNSLIDDKNIAGWNFFVWEEEFKEIMNNGGFDVVVGNPPYVKARDSKNPTSRKYMETCGQYETLYKMWDLYIAFVEKSIKLLKPNGCFSMIIPDTIGEADYTIKLVEIIIHKYSLYQIDFFPHLEVFPGVGIRNKIIFVKNSKKIYKCKRILHDSRIDLIKELDSMENNNLDVFRLNHSRIKFNFKLAFPLDRICYVSYGARFNSDKSDKNKFKKEDLLSENRDKIHSKIYTEGKYINRYSIRKEIYVEWDTERCPKRLVRPTFPQLYLPNKIMMSRQKRIATYSDKGHICDNTIIVGVLYNELIGVNNKGIQKYMKNIKINRKNAEEQSKRYNIKYLLSIINSKLMKYFLNIYSRSKIDSYPDDWKKILIKEANDTEQKKLIENVDKMLSLNNKLNELGNKNSDLRAKLEAEIKKTDQEIDELVYKLYGITEEEKKIVEESLK